MRSPAGDALRPPLGELVIAWLGFAAAAVLVVTVVAVARRVTTSRRRRAG
jgi:hypothetical protein